MQLLSGISKGVIKSNDTGMASRKAPMPLHINDSAMKQHARALPMAPVHPNDVGIAQHFGAPVSTSSTRGMTRTELHSRRQEMGRKPRG